MTTNPQPTPPAGWKAEPATGAERISHPWSRDPIHDEVANESKSQGEQGDSDHAKWLRAHPHGYKDAPRSTGIAISTQPEEVESCPALTTLKAGSNAAPADGPNPSPGAAEQPLCPFCQQKPVQWTPDLIGCANKDCPIGGSIFRNESWNIRTPPPVDGSGPTAEEMLTWLEQFIRLDDIGDETYVWGFVVDHEKLQDALTWGPMINGKAELRVTKETTLRAAIAQAMQSK